MHAYDETAVAAVREMLAGGFDPTSEEALELATEAASFDERSAYRDSGNQPNRVGGGARGAEVLSLLIAAGLPNPGKLLRTVKGPDAAKVLLETKPAQAEIDAGLLAQCNEQSFDPNVEVIRMLIAAGPSATAIDDGLLMATKGASRYRGVPVELAFFDVFDAFLEAGAHADRGTPTALHYFAYFAPEDSLKKRAARALATFTRALQGANVDLPDQNGMTPLHLAAQHGALDRIPLLLAAGADKERRANDGSLPSDLAHRNPLIYAALGVAPPAPPAPRNRAPAKPRPVAKPLETFRVTVRIKHATFGFGEITGVTGEGDKRKLTIRFDSGDVKMMSPSFVTPL